MVKNNLHRSSSWLAAACLAICLMFLLSQATFAEGYSSQQALPIMPDPAFLRNAIASPTDQVPSAFFPVVLNRSGAGIIGIVTQNGRPAGNVTLNLRIIDTGPVVVGTAVTDSSGFYEFNNADTLAAGQTYQVVYYYSYGTNDSVTGRLASWKTKMISTYTRGQNVNIGNFDIANVALSSPAEGDSQSLPLTFSWIRRVHSTTDSYEVIIVDFTTPPDTWTNKFSSLELGYVNHFSFQSSNWPAGMAYKYAYFWYVMIQAPDTGSGATRVMQHISFLPSP